MAPACLAPFCFQQHGPTTASTAELPPSATRTLRESWPRPIVTVLVRRQAPSPALRVLARHAPPFAAATRATLKAIFVSDRPALQARAPPNDLHAAAPFRCGP